MRNKFNFTDEVIKETTMNNETLQTARKVIASVAITSGITVGLILAPAATCSGALFISATCFVYTLIED